MRRMHRRASMVLMWVLLGGARRRYSPQAQSASSEAGKRPDYEDRRFDEDWSVLREVDLSGRDHIWDRLKFIPLSEGRTCLAHAGRTDPRALDEHYHQLDFGQSQPEQSGGFLLSRSAQRRPARRSIFASSPRPRARRRATATSRRAKVRASSIPSISRMPCDVVIPLGSPAT